MESIPENLVKYFGRFDPLAEAEVDELATALRKLASEGIALPRHLLRHAYEPKLNGVRHYGRTLDALPRALERLGTDREKVVVGLIRQFAQAVRDHHRNVNDRVKGAPPDRTITERYFATAFFLEVAKPKTEESAAQVADFLRSEFDEVRSHAAEMLEGTVYSPSSLIACLVQQSDQQ